MEYLQYYMKFFQVHQKKTVLNLIINGIPSILTKWKQKYPSPTVLNLIINGIPSIHIKKGYVEANKKHIRFKPYYKWNTFNTFDDYESVLGYRGSVLNLIINGIPSILKRFNRRSSVCKVLNLIINGIPSIPLICIRILILQ